MSLFVAQKNTNSKINCPSIRFVLLFCFCRFLTLIAGTIGAQQPFRKSKTTNKITQASFDPRAADSLGVRLIPQSGKSATFLFSLYFLSITSDHMLAPVECQVPASMSPMIVSSHCPWLKKIPIQRSITQVSDLCFLFFCLFEFSSKGDWRTETF